MRDSRGSARAGAAGSVAAVGAVVLLVLLAVWGATVGTGPVVSGSPPPHRATVPTQTPTSSTDAETGSRHQTRPDELRDHPVLEALVAALVTGAVLVALWATLSLARAVWRGRPGPRAARSTTPDVPFDVLTTPYALAERLVEQAPAQRLALEGGTPRNGIVACWHRFEQTAGDLGLARAPAETSGEFVLRLLDSVDADSAAMTALADLYREARFSRHELDESRRAAAREALDRVLATVPRGLGARTLS